MHSRRALFTLGLSRLVDEIDPSPPPRAPAQVPVPPARRAWPRGGGTELWAPCRDALPRAAGPDVLDLDLDPELDLASLPFEDARFDAVLSAFGPMFSSDGRMAIDELFRVVRPGGTVAFTAWTGLGVIGRLLRLAATHDPLPAGVPGPLAWGREERLRQDLDGHSDDAGLELLELTLRFESCEQAVDRLLGALGPLSVAPRQDELRVQAREVVEELALVEAGQVQLRARYLLAVAVRRPVLY